MRKILFFLTLISVLHATAQKNKKPAIDKRIAGLDTAITKLLNDWHGAGCGVAIIEKNQVILAKGFGYKDWEKKLPATENTLFAIGSCTKAFTSSLLGMAVKDGKLDLDKPVTNYLPELKFYNEYLTDHVTTRDMMCHRTGLPRHDYAWYGSSSPRDSLIYRIRYFEPSAELRTTWQYNNFMFVAQGVLAEKIYQKKWEQLIKEKIFDPLQMSSSNFSVNDLQKSPDFSYGYGEKNDSVNLLPYMNIDPIGPAGSINSSAKEMANWVKAWMNGGKFEERELLSPTYIQQAISSQMVAGAGLPSKDIKDNSFSNYGFGWFLSSYRGHYMVQHGGNIDGFSASTSFFPGDSVGIVVLVNQNGSVLPSLIRNAIADRMLGLPYRNWSKLQKDAMEKNKSTAKGPDMDSVNKKPNTKPSHPLADYAGRFHNDGYGELDINLSKDTLWLSYNNNKEKMYLKHYHYDIFTLKVGTSDKTDQGLKINFNTDSRGNIETFSLPLESSVKDIVFERAAPVKKVVKADLEKYIGDYNLNGATVKVYVRGENTLMVLVPGQPDYELVPSKQDEFNLKVAKGYSVKFDVDAQGKASALSFIQPNGIFKAEKKK